MRFAIPTGAEAQRFIGGNWDEAIAAKDAALARLARLSAFGGAKWFEGVSTDPTRSPRR